MNLKGSLIFLSLVSLSAISPARATDAALSGGEGGSSGMGGGGGAVVYKDRVEMADPYMKRAANTDLHCHGGWQMLLNEYPRSERHETPERKALKEQLKVMGHLLVRFGASRTDRSWHSKLDAALFMQTDVLSENVTYCMEKELPAEEKLSDFDLPPGALSKQPVASTQGPMTWIDEKLFWAMSPQDQALLVIHERLHAAFGYVSHSVIAEITDGLRVGSELFLAQQRGERPRLNADQMVKLTRLARQIQNIRMNKDWGRPSLLAEMVVVAQGGGFAHKQSRISPKSYIGVGSLVGREAIVYDDVEIINSDFCTLWEYDSDGRGGKATSLFKRFESGEPARVYPRAKILNSTISSCSKKMDVLYDSVIEGSLINSSIISPYTQIGERAKVQNTVLLNFTDLWLGNDSVLSNVAFKSLRSDALARAASHNVLDIALHIGNKAELKNIRATEMVGARKNIWRFLDAFTFGPTKEEGPVLEFNHGFKLDQRGMGLCDGLSDEPQEVFFKGYNMLKKPKDRSDVCERNY